jgi:hypothetical protein
MKLVYVPKPGFAAPPDGWPAGDHEELDEKLAKQKLASEFYKAPKVNGASKPPKGGNAE